MLPAKERKKKHSHPSKANLSENEPSISLPFGNPAYTPPPVQPRKGNLACIPPVQPRRKESLQSNRPAVPAKKWAKDSPKLSSSDEHSISSPLHTGKRHHNSSSDATNSATLPSQYRRSENNYSKGKLHDQFNGQTANTPPPLPERPKDILTTAPNERSLKLQEAVQRHSNHFPFHFRVAQGYCSSTSDVTMSTGDVYAVHRTEDIVFAIATGDDGLTHQIPHRPSQKIGIIYDPENNAEKGLNGYMYETVADLIAGSSTPKVVCATREVRSNDGKYLTEPNEILILIQIHKGRFKSKKTVVFYSMLSKSEKTLPQSCAGYFSTKPSLIQLGLQDIISHVPEPFPVKAVIYCSADNDVSSLKHGVVMISGYSKQSSLVVSTCSVDGSESVSSETETASLKDCFHLIMDEDIRELEVQIFDEEETDIDSFPATVDEPGSHEYNTLSRETGFRGPRSLDEDGYMDVFHPSATTDRQEPFEEYSTISISSSRSADPTPSIQPNYDDVVVPTETQEYIYQDTSIVDQMKESTKKTSSYENHNIHVARLQEQISKLTQRLDLVESQLQTVLRPAVLPTSETAIPRSTNSRNKGSLQSLDVEGVCVLLESSDLGKYRPMIQREHVTGDILAVLDDGVLETELGIKSKLHRLRVLKMISEYK
ncbi:uncharacterized protein LOC135348607 [Halichondria panicea]|uniref:uncharacterized protein LOC135348607 n=1 Tax=Halichondria panicea TaxID=6063 RepID=UPI00312BB414